MYQFQVTFTSKVTNPQSQQYSFTLELSNNEDEIVDFILKTYNFLTYLCSINPQVTFRENPALDEKQRYNHRFCWHKSLNAKSDIAYIYFNRRNPVISPFKLIYLYFKCIYTSSFLFNLWKMITLVVACRSSSLPRIYLNLVSQKSEVFGNLFILKAEVIFLHREV